MPLTRHILYPAVLMPQQGNSKMFHVSFPDIPDCLADGEGIKEAMYHASKALMLALSKQDTVPESSDILIIQHNNPEANVLYISIDLTDFSQNLKIAMVSKEIFLPVWLDTLASEHNINLSATLIEGLHQKLGI